MPGIIRSDVEALIEANVSREIIKGVTTESIALRAFRRLPNMSTNKTKMRVLDALPVAYWVNNKNNNGRKNITRAAWDNKFITAAEIAVIVPIKDDLIDDADVDIWGEIQPLVVEAFHKTIDDAIITGTNKPEEWRADLLTSILNAGAVVEPAEGQSLYSIKTGTQRTFTVTGDRYIGDEFQDFAFSHKIAYGTGQDVVVPYVFFNLKNGKGEAGYVSIIVNSDASGNAGDNATISIDLRKTGPKPIEYTYTLTTE